MQMLIETVIVAGIFCLIGLMLFAIMYLIIDVWYLNWYIDNGKNVSEIERDLQIKIKRLEIVLILTFIFTIGILYNSLFVT